MTAPEVLPTPSSSISLGQREARPRIGWVIGLFTFHDATLRRLGSTMPPCTFFEARRVSCISGSGSLHCLQKTNCSVLLYINSPFPSPSVIFVPHPPTFSFEPALPVSPFASSLCSFLRIVVNGSQRVFRFSFLLLHWAELGVVSFYRRPPHPEWTYDISKSAVLEVPGGRIAAANSDGMASRVALNPLMFMFGLRLQFCHPIRDVLIFLGLASVQLHPNA